MRTPLPLLKRFRTIMLVLAGVSAAGAFAQMVPDAPVKNFRLPMFGDDGYRVWDLRGREGRYVSRDQVDVIDMRLFVFSSEQPNQVQTEIRSPKATMLIRENRAQGDESILVVGDAFQVEGQRWLWDGEANRVVIDEQVKVTFFEELSGFLQ